MIFLLSSLQDTTTKIQPSLNVKYIVRKEHYPSDRFKRSDGWLTRKSKDLRERLREVPTGTVYC